MRCDNDRISSIEHDTYCGTSNTVETIALTTEMTNSWNTSCVLMIYFIADVVSPRVMQSEYLLINIPSTFVTLILYIRANVIE